MIKNKFTKLGIIASLFLILSVVIFNFVPAVEASVAGQTNVHDLSISYSGGSNNIIRYLPEEFRNERYKTTGDLSLPGSSIKIMGPENEKYIYNIKRGIKILEYLKNTIGLDEAATLPGLLDIVLYNENAEQDMISLGGDSSYGPTVAADKNPTLGEILSENIYIDPIITTNTKLTEEILDAALEDLKEHEAEGTVDNFLYGFSMFNLLIIEVMSIMFLIFGGLVWLTSGGEESQIERGKKTILWALVGIVGGLLSYTVINIIIQLFTT